MIKDEIQLDEIIEAKRQGHRFIKLFLNRKMINKGQVEISISGAMALRAVKKGIGIGGMPEYKFIPVDGESMNFRFERSEREFVCWLYDDQGPGYFSQLGYNRDLLATHVDDEFFIIDDPAIRADVMKRHDFIKKNPGAKNPAQDHTTFAQTPIKTEQDIDRQIEILMQKKKALSEQRQPEAFTETDTTVKPDSVPEVAEFLGTDDPMQKIEQDGQNFDKQFENKSFDPNSFQVPTLTDDQRRAILDQEKEEEDRERKRKRNEKQREYRRRKKLEEQQKSKEPVEANA